MAIPSDLLDWVCEDNFCVEKKKDETVKPRSNVVQHEHLNRNDIFPISTLLPEDEASQVERNAQGNFQVLYTNLFCYLHSLITDYC